MKKGRDGESIKAVKRREDHRENGLLLKTYFLHFTDYPRVGPGCWVLSAVLLLREIVTVTIILVSL